jgi:hypothetical protein
MECIEKIIWPKISIPPPIVEETDRIREVLWRATCNDWFEYPTRSRIHYWHFPKCYQSEVRDGVKIWFRAEGPSLMRPQAPPLG